MSRIAAIIPAAGLGTRMGADMPKQFLELDGMPLIIFTLRRLAACAAITDFFIATRGDLTASETKSRKRAWAVPCAWCTEATPASNPSPTPLRKWIRHGNCAGARCRSPVRYPAQIDRVIAEARARGAAILGIPAIDTVKEVKRASLPEDVALISATIPRERIVLAQTPQVFSYSLLRDAFRKAEQDDFTGSDEAALVERFGHDVFVVLGSERNLKITRPADMDLARFYLEQERSQQ